MMITLKGKKGVSSQFKIVPQYDTYGNLPIPCYRQQDGHSCGYLAILAVVQYFYPEVTPQEVLQVVQPDQNGCNQKKVLKSLKKLGVTTRYETKLTPSKVHQYIQAHQPIIVTVEPEWYPCDHWTVIRGMVYPANWVYLTNFEEEAMEWRQFKNVWSPIGEGIVCTTEKR